MADLIRLFSPQFEVPRDAALVAISGTFLMLSTALGGWIAIRTQNKAEQRRDASEMQGFVNQLRTDLLRWGTACEEMAVFSRTLRGPSLRWDDIVAPGSRYLPPHLFALLFVIYNERDRTENAYAEFGQGIAAGRRSYAARFQLRRWSKMAHEFIERWDADRMTTKPKYDWLTFWKRETREPFDFAQQETLLDEFMESVGARLKDEWGYLTDKDCQLTPEMFTEKNFKAMADEFQQLQQRNHQS